MANAVIYARFSCSRQREESIEDQVRVCTDAAKSAGDNIVHVYADAAMSGKTDERPQFRRMIADSASGAWSKVYVYKLDRFARNRYDAATNRARLRKNGVTVEPVAEHIPDGAEGILFESILEGMAEYYSAQLAENVRRGIEGNARRCMANGQRLYGYDIVDGHYVINEREAQTVRHIFGAVAGGSTIVDAYKSAPSPMRSGKPWTHSAAGKLLRSEKYAGVYTYAGVRVEGGMPAIIDAETFAAVQRRLGERSHAARIDDATYLLSGKLHDVDGSPLVGVSGTGRSGATYHYYRRRNGGRSYPRDEMDERVARIVADALEDEAIIAEVAALILEAQDAERSSETDRAAIIRDEAAQLELDYERAVDAALTIGVDEAVKRRIDEMRLRRAELQAELAEVEASFPHITAEMVEFWLYDIRATTDVESLLASFVSRVDMLEDGRLEVRLIMGDVKNETNPPPGEAEGSCSDLMVHHGRIRTNRATIYALPLGLAIVA